MQSEHPEAAIIVPEGPARPEEPRELILDRLEILGDARRFYRARVEALTNAEEFYAAELEAIEKA